MAKQKKHSTTLDNFCKRYINWALRDAVAHNGANDKIRSRNFGDVSEKDKGRNTLASEHGPQIRWLQYLFPSSTRQIMPQAIFEHHDQFRTQNTCNIALG